MSQEINRLKRKINELNSALRKDNISERTRFEIETRLRDVKSQLVMWQNSNRGSK